MTHSPRFKDRVAIVTGGAAGIGAATVKLMARDGAKVVIVDVAEEAGNNLAKEIGVERALFVSCDIGDQNAVEAMIDAAVQRFGSIDILVNNAAVFGGMGMQTPDLPLETWERTIRIALTGTFLCCKSAIPHMRARGKGAIVNVGSVSGIRGDNGFSAYNAAKGAVLNYTRTLAIDHGRDGIRVNAVCPGPVLTGRPMLTQPDVQDVFMPRIPLRRYGQPEDIANGIAFLASDDADWITGVILPVDGGVTTHNGQPDLTGFLANSVHHKA
jgi:meso-butanediol dehydrogenase / (S,S)-butanediol dehydrogenase / diacetyl reductase